MKKLKLFVCILTIAVAAALSLTACGSAKDVPKITTTPITIYVDGIPQQFTATLNSTVDVGALSKRGSYLVGIDDEAGNRYFDEAGRSLLPWNEANPSTFYAKFEEMNTLEYEYKTLATETVEIDSSSSSNFNYSYGSTKAVQFLSALKGNPTRTVHIAFDFLLRSDKGLFWTQKLFIKVLANGDETIGSYTIAEESADFIKYSYVADARAEQLVNGFTIRFSNTDTSLYSKYVKYVNCKITIV